jgi:predicted nucleotidyltransferase
MSSHVERLAKKGLAQPPRWLAQNIHYEVMVGSVSYGVSTDTSDMDVAGFCMPPKEMLFPHLAGDIMGFGNQVERFQQYQQHHIMDKEKNQEYDLTIYSIVKFFQLVMENNPNMVDTLYVPQRCVLYASPIGQMVRDNRKMFLHKGSFSKFRGYAFAQLHKIGTKANASNPKRQASIDEYGYDVKFAYHVVRLALECEQILVEHDLDITRSREVLKAIRRGEWTEEYLRDWFGEKEKHLEELKVKSTLRENPDEDAIRELLLNCIEHHYGSLSTVVSKDVKIDRLVSEMQSVLDRYK